MRNAAQGTLARADKGPVARAPALDGPLQAIVDRVSSWSGIETTVHWDLVDRSRVDGVDFYWSKEEVGHLHLDGAIHLATDAVLGEALVAEGVARPFRYQRGWVEERVADIGLDAAVDLFRRNYARLVSIASDGAA